MTGDQRPPAAEARAVVAFRFALGLNSMCSAQRGSRELATVRPSEHRVGERASQPSVPERTVMTAGQRLVKVPQGRVKPSRVHRRRWNDALPRGHGRRLRRTWSALLLLCAAALSHAPTASAQETTEQKLARETLEKNNSTFRFGLSVGWRRVVGPSSALLQDVALDPATGNVTVDPIDRSAVVLSGVVSAFPWRNTELGTSLAPKQVTPPRNFAERIKRGSAAWRWGFLANVNVASFTQENIAVFNQTVEGGLGIAYKMNESFAVGLTAERLKGRALRSFVPVGSPLIGADGKSVTELAPTDNRFFRDDNLTAVSLKFVYFFN